MVRVPSGFAEELFSDIRVMPIPPQKHPFVVGYIGSISDRFDFSLLEKVIKKLPSAHFFFIGSFEPDVFGRCDDAMDQFNNILKYTNTRWIRGVPKKDIPSALATIDVGLIPYRTDSSFNRLSFPMKALEYFAAGRPVVSANITALRAYADKGLLTIAERQKVFVQAIRKYQRTGWNVSVQKRQLRAAVAQSWSKKVKVILSELCV